MKPQWWKLAVGIVFAGQGMVLGLAVNLSQPSPTVRFGLQSAVLALTLGVVGLLGGGLAVAATKALRQRRLTMEALFLVAIAGAMGVSLPSYLSGHGPIYFEVVSVLLVVYSLNDLLRTRARSFAVAATRRWLDRLNVARRQSPDGRLQFVPAASIQVGDRVEVYPGESITIDGVIERGQAFICETPLTGEPFAQVRRPGEKVQAGSVAEDGSLTLRATAAGDSRAIDDVLTAVEEARRTRISLQTQIDRWSRVFLPLVLLVAIATFFGWWSVAGWERGLFHALSVLLVACPCALGLAAPLAIWAAMSGLAGRGLVAHQAEFVERLAKVNHVVFDKTGTLTEDSATITEIAVAPHLSRHKVLSWLCAAESRSRHPIARALAVCAEGQAPLAATSQMQVQTHPGRGLEASFVDCCGKQRRLRAGTPQWIAAENESYQALLSTLPAQQGDPIAVETDGDLAAVCLVRETVRPSAQSAWQECQRLGLAVSLLTGDRVERATAAGFEKAVGRLTPLEKSDLVQQWQANGAHCLFVGDGINDAPALSHASASIALASGAELAAASAHATLISGDLTAIPWAVQCSRQALQLIRSNLIWAASYNAIGVVLAAAGLLHPVVAALLMVGSSLLVTGRSIRFADAQREQRSQPTSAVPAVSEQSELNGACCCK